MIEALEFLALGTAAMLGIVIATLLFVFGVGLIATSRQYEAGVSRLFQKKFWSRDLDGVDIVDVMLTGAHISVYVVMVVATIVTLTLFGVVVAHCQAVAEPTPVQMHQWMNDVGARYVDTFERDGAAFSLFMGGTFGGQPTEGFVFMFKNPRRASAVIITLANRLNEAESNAEINALCDIAQGLTKERGMPGTGTDGQIEFTFPTQTGLLIVTRTQKPDGYQSQFMMLWGVRKGKPA